MKKTIIAILLLLLAAVGGNQVAQLGGSPGALPATLATTSTASVGDRSVNVLIATTTSSFGSAAICSARLVTTQGQPIKIVSPGVSKGPYGTTTLQLGDGHLQLASTTVVYSSDDWGCGALIMMGAGSGTTTVTITETRQ